MQLPASASRGQPSTQGRGLASSQVRDAQRTDITQSGQPACRRVKELERELHREDKALAETAALLVLSKKLAAVFHEGEDV